MGENPSVTQSLCDWARCHTSGVLSALRSALVPPLGNLLGVGHGRDLAVRLGQRRRLRAWSGCARGRPVFVWGARCAACSAVKWPMLRGRTAVGPRTGAAGRFCRPCCWSTANSLWTHGLPSLRVLNQSKCTRYLVLILSTIHYHLIHIYTPLSHLVT